MFSLRLLCVPLLCAMHAVEAYRVLMVSPMPGKSHVILGNGVVRHLLNAGHEVTYITAAPNSLKQHPLLTEVDISVLGRLMPAEAFSMEKILKKEIDLRDMTKLTPMFIGLHSACLENENVTNLMSDPEKHFDVVIVEWLFVELLSGIAAVFNCPFIYLSTSEPSWNVLKLIDGLTNPAYTVGITSNNAEPLSFLQRAEEFLHMTIGLCLEHIYVNIQQREFDRILRPIIRKRGHRVPDFEAVRYNASLILGNTHVSIGNTIGLPQNYKVIGGYHIDEKVHTLPQNLQELLDNSKNGLIYFSMGSHARSKHMPSELKSSLLKMFGKLKQTVLWKLEEDLPSKPKNVHIMSWAPQQNILAHPNCVLFITHGGLLSTTEAVYFGKPTIGIPLFGDQFANIERSVKRGFAKRVDLSYTMADDLEKAIIDMLDNPSYLTKVKEFSFIYHDRPVSPGKELVHWVEHVVRTGGAPHLRSPAFLMPWYQQCYLDLGAVIMAILTTLLLAIKKITNYSKPQRKSKMH